MLNDTWAMTEQSRHCCHTCSDVVTLCCVFHYHLLDSIGLDRLFAFARFFFVIAFCRGPKLPVAECKGLTGLVVCICRPRHVVVA